MPRLFSADRLFFAAFVFVQRELFRDRDRVSAVYACLSLFLLFLTGGGTAGVMTQPLHVVSAAL